MASYMIEYIGKNDNGDVDELCWQFLRDEYDAADMVKYVKRQGYLYNLFIHEGGVHSATTEVCFD